MNNNTNTTMDNLPAPVSDVSATGIAGLDDILCGGFTPFRLYLIEGVPGSGKTTLAMQYLLEGARRGEQVLYVTLSETEEELRAMAEAHGFDLTGVWWLSVASVFVQLGLSSLLLRREFTRRLAFPPLEAATVSIPAPAVTA